MVIAKDETTIVEGHGDREDIEGRIDQIKAADRERPTSDWDREKLQERLGKLAGCVAVIKVGAATEVELKEKKHRVEDALSATRAAIEEGIVPGGGVALINAASVLDDNLGLTGDEATGVRVVRKALEEPLRRIARTPANGYVVTSQGRELGVGHGYDAATRRVRRPGRAGHHRPGQGHPLRPGQRPSIAAMLLTTETLIVEKPEDEEPRRRRSRPRPRPLIDSTCSTASHDRPAPGDRGGPVAVLGRCGTTPHVCALQPDRVRFAVLGPLHVAGEEVSRHLAGHKERAVLAILLARGAAGATGDELVAALWGAQPPPSAERSLQAHVSRVRSSVAPTPVVRRPEGWFLDASDEVDAARFEGFLDRARRAARQEAWVETGGLVESALALWRGEPFGGFAHLDPCAVEADRLRTLKAEAEELAMVSRLALGEASTLVDGLRQMTAAEPFREDRWSLLMTALYRAGRQADALAAYDEARRLLADELGIDPSPELRTRRQQVLEQDPALRAPLRSVRASLPDAPYRGLAAYRDRDAGVFVGRERLLARVLYWVAETRVVTLAGVSGSGKSSLLQAGLLPALRAGDLPGSEGWRIVVATPGTLDTEKAGADLVVLDQAEELFTVLEDERRAELARALAAAVVGGGRLVLAIRADHWARCADLPELAELVGESSLLVPAMTEDELRRVVLEPHGDSVSRWRRPSSTSCSRTRRAARGGLPLVSTALTRAWERARSGRVTVEDLQASGGVADAVASRGGGVAVAVRGRASHGEGRPAPARGRQ